MSTSEVIAALAEAVQTVPVDDLPRMLGAMAEAQARLQLRLATPRPEDHRADVRDANISVAEAAQRLGVSPSYIYKNAKNLPFVVRIGRRRVCSMNRLERWNRTRLGY